MYDLQTFKKYNRVIQALKCSLLSENYELLEVLCLTHLEYPILYLLTNILS